jgi:hypothetical protein
MLLRNSKIASLLTKAAIGPLGIAAKPFELIGKGLVKGVVAVGKAAIKHPGISLPLGLGTAAVAGEAAHQIGRSNRGLSREYLQARRASEYELPKLPK